jgi:hypothetical protein
MNRRIRILCLVVLAGCGAGQPLVTSLAGTSPLPAPDAFSCLRDQLKTTGFAQTSYDVDDMRLTARKNDDTARRPDVQFRRLIDRIEFEVRPGTGDAVTEITGEAKTFAEYSTQRGPTEEQQKPSETAENAVRALIKKCSAPLDSLSRQG